ncbi:receptor-like protein EIX2 [Musa acuminata AAA Group]|uniref:receptor-like protein EIX2 n=1 Tax=Musa acuminata AAA Group TaxID=214697 RepID=UPI0031DF5A4F
MATDSVYVLFFLLAFVCIQLIKPNVCDGALTAGCIPAERSALLEFKRGLEDPTNRLSSWVGEDCCKWEGVTCSNHTGHVVKLDLQNPDPFSDFGDEPYNNWTLGGNLASLEKLNLAFNSLQGGLPTSFKNLCKLKNLILTAINIRQDLLELDEIFSGCIKMSLEVLGLSGTNISGQLPEWLFQLRKLKSLQLEHNLISGPIPVSIGQLASLQELFLGQNQLNETIPESVGWLSQLVTLDLQHNNLEGVMSEAHFGNLTELKYLYLSSNSALKVKSNWLPPFQLDSLRMDSCKQGPEFPAWLQSQKNISEIVMSNASIIDAMPDWFWSLISTAVYVSVSGNQISGHVPNLLHVNNLYQLDLSSNYLEGPLPYFPPGLELLDLSNNSFSGTISLAIFTNMPNLQYLSFSENNLSGEIPFSICNLSVLQVLDLSKNMLSGELPSCWSNSSRIRVMDFSSNNISGVIPESICSIVWLQSLHLSNNSLSGELPLSLKDCGKLILLDAGHNDLKGEIPTWIGESLTSLRFLNLRSNMLAGDITPNLSQLSALQFLDLADNKLSGTIPRSFGNFTAMKVIGKFSSWITNSIGYKEQMLITTKGNTLDYDILLSLMNILDLSDNNLFGGVPEELTSLSGLFSLNLSGNHFTGEIIENISKLQQLESLDLSRNNFSGIIPSSLTVLTYLAHLNLSYNNLSGEIPLGNQLLTFNDPSIYIGNPDLCGFPLNQSCKDSETAQSQSNTDDRDKNEMIWFYTSIAPGFVVGFWAVWVP